MRGAADLASTEISPIPWPSFLHTRALLGVHPQPGRMRLLRGFANRLLTVLLIISPFLTAVLALQANLAGIVDWYKPLIGSPLLEPTPPFLTDTPTGRRLVTITKKNVLAVLDAQSADIGM